MQNILESISGHSLQSAIVIRHAERFDIVGAEGYWTTGLTDRGLEDAREFGVSLGDHLDSCRLFYSPVKRCRQTAECIASALGDSGRFVSTIQPEKLLGVSYILVDPEEGFNEADRHGDNFIRAWFDGAVPPYIFRPLAKTRDEHIEYLRAKLASADGGRHLDIHVTHDWNINVLREGIFDLRHEDAGWPGYLSGLAFAKEPFEAIVENCGSVLRKRL